MTDTDPITELADTLYDALYAITPYAEPYFADERHGLENAVRAVLAEAAAKQWIEKQLAETGLRAMDFRHGMSMEIEPAREMVAHWVGAARAMLGDAPNYTETTIEMEVKVGESPERYAFVLQRVGKLTPHQARQHAEQRVNRILAECDAIEAEIHGQHDEDDDGMREAVRRIREAAGSD
ncbi:hypothetical protein ACFV4E_22665 [Streptomyces hygroscopicus]|uniref:hypothetical protein n=1 Tax=Streptomyces hygroscopicus TaxID=1912 RepID=UPI0036A480BB